MTSGVPAERLSDDDLRHDLLQLKKKQADIERDGTADQKLNHERRTAELEAEFAQRFGSDRREKGSADVADGVEAADAAAGDADSADSDGSPAESGGAKSTEVAGSDF